MIKLSDYISDYSILKCPAKFTPWELTTKIENFLIELIADLTDDYIIKEQTAIHKSSKIEAGVVMKGPIIIGENCFIGAHAYLRGGVWLARNVSIGPGCEIKSSFIFPNSSVAHFNFIGDSIIGSRVNFEAGAVTANHHNDRADKRIFVNYNSQQINTGVQKFGALIGDDCKIGANAVLSPGTLLEKTRIVKRLELI